MNINSLEKEIIKMYVNENKQERILWELGNHRKRETVIWRFSGPTLFKSKCLHPIKHMPCAELEKHLLRQNGIREVYFIGESYIGTLSLNQAIVKANTGERCIVYCGEGLGYYQGECEYGNTPRFLLLQNRGQEDSSIVP